MHKFPYKWYLKDGYPAKGIKPNGLNVFGTFICGGGSTMGYKLAGFNHLGGVEIDKKLANVYNVNHEPKYLYIEDIRLFNKRTDLPKELYKLDLLDGSPPCASFSLSGNREKDWNKQKKFREGQVEQKLDDLVFEYIKTIDKLQPKVALLENVKGLIQGNAKVYAKEIHKRFTRAGYNVQVFCLNAATMGVPQRRERVFFLGLRNDIDKLKLDLTFNGDRISFGDLGTMLETHQDKLTTLTAKKYWGICKPGFSFSTVAASSFFNWCRLNEHNTPPTLHGKTAQIHHPKIMRPVNKKECKLISSFPMDYKFINVNYSMVLGMSVPPVMIAQIANQIYLQWLN